MSNHKSSCKCITCNSEHARIQAAHPTAKAKRDEIIRIAITLDMGLQALLRTVQAWFFDFEDLRSEFATAQDLYKSVYPAVWER